ncbi:MAG: DMT family transporter [Alphaproteobacteria bacterium]|nr:DMT family transporter [Alphaproteobacteria bacterium]
MAIPPPASPPMQSRVVAGIICVEMGAVIFAIQDGMMKALLGEFTVWMLITARAIVTLLILVPTILWLGKPHRLYTPHWPLHLLRALLFSFGFSLYYTAFPFMGLAELTTIFFSAPLITAVLAALFLGETIGIRRLACLLVGFAGVVIAMNPTSDAFQPIAVLPLICAITYSFSQLIARKIGERDTSLTLGLYTIALSGVLIMPLGLAVNGMFDLGSEFSHLRWEWQVPDLTGGATLMLLGAIGMTGYMLLSRAYQIANASLIAPFDYSYLPIAAIMAYFVWNEIPSWHTILGMVLIIGSGLYLGYREIRQVRLNSDPAPTAVVAFVPGSPVDALVHSSDSLTEEPAYAVHHKIARETSYPQSARGSLDSVWPLA